MGLEIVKIPWLEKAIEENRGSFFLKDSVKSKIYVANLKNGWDWGKYYS